MIGNPRTIIMNEIGMSFYCESSVAAASLQTFGPFNDLFDSAHFVQVLDVTQSYWARKCLSEALLKICESTGLKNPLEA
jgi:hypothetical protein